MSGSVTRAQGWCINDEEQYLAVSPSGEVVSLYQTDSTTDNEDNNIVKISEKTELENIQCINYSAATPGLTGIGQLDGKCILFDIRNPSTQSVVLKPLQSRSCNSISFNENGLIAMGYDRGRQDHSIHVWDMNCLQNGDFRGKTNKIFSCINNESISSLSFCPTEPKNFVAGSYKLLREYDVRSNQPIYQIATRCTLNITVNPFTPFMFASNSEDGSLAIWDRRKLTESFRITNMNQSTAVLNEAPVLSFNKLLNDYQRRSNGSPYRFSSVQQGEISALFDGDLVRRWRIGQVPAFEEEIIQYNSMVKQNKKENPMFIPKLPKPTGSMFVSKVHDTKTKYERVISYDYAPSKTSIYGIDLVCMRQSGSIYKMKVTDSQKSIVFNSYNDLTFSGTDGVCSKYVKDAINERVFDINKNTEFVEKLQDLSLNNQIGNKLEPENLNEINNKSGLQKNSSMQIQDDNEIDVYIGEADTMCVVSDKLLENDICSTMRNRATKGYGVDAKKDMEILDSIETYETHLHLKNAWKWIDISYNLISAGKMHYNNFDFGYLGVLGICNMNKDYMVFNRYTGFENVTENDVTYAAKCIVERRAKEYGLLAKPVIGFNGKSSKEIERKLAMYVIGWDFGARELEDKLNGLISGGNYERAAGWAIFHGDINRAINILGESNNENYKIMSTAIAAYSAFTDSTTNNTWKDRCRQLASELADPYLRTIFAYIADGNWWDVLDESALPLRERLGVALRFLPDSDLDIYLNRVADTVIERGNVEGIILTGITMKGVNLLQSFVDRTQDIQSACLISSFACPKYFTDDRVESWVDDYRSLLNSWSLFSVRAKFDIARNKLSKKINEQSAIPPVPRQLFLQCINCNKSIINEPLVGALKSRKRNTKTSCNNCGYPLPRCAICLITQGVPVPKEVMHMNHFGDEEATGPDVTIDTNRRHNTNSHADIDATLKSGDNTDNESQFKEWFSFCLSCNHCMHAGHAEEWFSKHYVCPVPDCDCKCNNR